MLLPIIDDEAPPCGTRTTRSHLTSRWMNLLGLKKKYLVGNEEKPSQFIIPLRTRTFVPFCKMVKNLRKLTIAMSLVLWYLTAVFGTRNMLTVLPWPPSDQKIGYSPTARLPLQVGHENVKNRNHKKKLDSLLICLLLFFGLDKFLLFYDARTPAQLVRPHNQEPTSSPAFAKFA